MPDLTDQEIVKRCSEGDREALAAAVQRHLPTLIRFARGRCDGELAANEIVLRAVGLAARDLRSCGEAKSVLAWLLRSVHLSCASLDSPAPSLSAPKGA